MIIKQQLFDEDEKVDNPFCHERVTVKVSMTVKISKSKTTGSKDTDESNVTINSKTFVKTKKL